jgi:hypothetical protein
MPLSALLNRVCDIWGIVPSNPEVEDHEEVETVVFPGVPCRVDSLLYRRSFEESVSGGTEGTKRAWLFIQDPRLSYPENFNENNWIVENGMRYNIIAVDESDSMFNMHHFEVYCEVGITR